MLAVLVLSASTYNVSITVVLRTFSRRSIDECENTNEEYVDEISHLDTQGEDRRNLIQNEDSDSCEELRVENILKLIERMAI